MKYILEKLIGNQDLTPEESYSVMQRIMSGEFDNAQISAFLIALRTKGLKSREIAGFARAMRDRMTPVPIQSQAIDMCGTGGDAKGTFNISTAASLVVAGSGINVAKHGNRSMTSRSGSADVLLALGVDITMSPDQVARCVDEIGIGFMFAPTLHPAIAQTSHAVQSIGVRTVFDVLGPLNNPAGVKRQILGVYDIRLTEKMAKVLKMLGAEEAMIVHGHDDMDEITTTSSTKITHLTETGEIDSSICSPSDFGLKTAKLEDLTGGSPNENARIIRTILSGEKGPHRDIVLVNAAAGIQIGGKAESIMDGMEYAAESIDSGKALKILDKLINR